MRLAAQRTLGVALSAVVLAGLAVSVWLWQSADEQRVIAEALSDVDALIAALDKLIAKKRAIKTAAMQVLLTGKKRLPGFGGEWEVKQLGEVVSVRSQKFDPRSAELGVGKIRN